MTDANQLVINEPLIENMIERSDFSSVEGNVPELVSYLLKVSPAIMHSAFEGALENNKVRKGMCNYIHETATQVLNQQFDIDIVKIEYEGLNDNNKKLGDVLILLAKKK